MTNAEHAGAAAGEGIAYGLPPEAYTSEAYLRREHARIFGCHWVFAGFAHELAEPGDVVPATVGGLPILLVRSRDGEVRAFHNVCRHRGLKLVAEACRGLQALTCPYHAWAYDLEGNLRTTPHFGGPRVQRPPGFDKAAFGLRPVRCVRWHDWLFVDTGGQAPPFEDYVAPLARQLAGIDLDRLVPLARIEIGTIRANWKFLVENFIEPYHVPVVHPRSAAGQPLGDHYMVVDGRLVGCAIDVRQDPAAKAGRAGTLAASALDMSARYLTLFPNFQMGVYFPDQVGVHVDLPLGPDRTRQWRMIYRMGGPAPDREAVDGLCALWRQVHEEDREIVERLQEGRASPVTADGGPLSPCWETSVHHFHELVREAVGRDEA